MRWLRQQTRFVMLFTIKGRVTVKHYMREDQPEIHEVTRTVEADSYDDACQKFIKHYEDKTDEYVIYYSAYVYRNPEEHDIIR